MTQEAMSKLSHLIRSKDVELEAANAKTNSLMEILRAQDQSAELGARYEELLGAKEKSDQLIVAKNEEINKLTGQLTELSNQFEQIKTEVSELNLSNSAQVQQCDQIEANCEETELSIATLNLLVKKIKEKSGLVERGKPDGAASSVVIPNGQMNEQAELMASSVRNLKERCDSLEAKNTVMKRDNDALRDQLMNRRDRWDALEINSQKLGKELASRDEQLTLLRHELEEAKARIFMTFYKGAKISQRLFYLEG